MNTNSIRRVRLGTKLVVALALAASTFAIGAASASAATGPVVSNGGVYAWATSSCSAGYVNATLTVQSRRNYQYVEVRSAALYDGAYGSSYYRQLDNAAEFSPLMARTFYAGQRSSVRWAEYAPRYGDQVVFFVKAAGYPTLVVKVACST
jgi:hypothetical protein